MHMEASGLALAGGNSTGGGTGRHVRQPALPSTDEQLGGQEGCGSLGPEAGWRNFSNLHLSTHPYLAAFRHRSGEPCPIPPALGPRGWLEVTELPPLMVLPHLPFKSMWGLDEWLGGALLAETLGLGG